MIDLGLTGKRAVVSGAGYIRDRAGHGWFTAITLAEAGATVACIDIDEFRANEVAAEIRSRGGTAFAVVADMTQVPEVTRALDTAERLMGGIDLCVDIIGGARWGKVEEVSDADWSWTIQHNLTQVFYLFREVARRMIAHGTGGSMVAVSSVDGIAAAGFHAPYGAAKAGVISLVKSFAQELGRHGIRVNAVAPGNVGNGNLGQPDDEFPVNPVNPLAAPRAYDIANAALFLSSTLAGRITGQTLAVDGGATIRELWGIGPEAIARFNDEGYAVALAEGAVHTALPQS